VVPGESDERDGVVQTVAVVGLLLAVGVSGYLWLTSALQGDDSSTAVAIDVRPAGGPLPPGSLPVPRTRLGDLSQFRPIVQDALQLVERGDQAGATARARDLEIAWDDAEARLKPRDKAAWTALDGKIDKVLREIRATSPNPAGEKAALTTLRDAVG